ncbi:MAG: right-handed parallel beta-helix repeat-containing protein, partial [Clostridiales bacterium]|nr:right-handed parallel beta-helix repeat-containing protein [Clostridiales bacterium]
MRNKKILSLIALTLCVLLLVGCGGAGAPAQTTAAPAQSAEAAEIPDGAVEVDNIDDMLAAIKDGAHIYLAPGVYDLSKAESYGSGTGGTYSWLETGDGSQLMISDVQDLTIEAQDAEKTIISALPRYATVMNFMNCENLTLKNITLGHVEGAGVCSGGVLYLGNCRGVTVDDCALFGCGTIGVQAEYSDSISVKNTEIYDCSYGASWIIGCYDIRFENCEIFDCAAIGAGLFAVENSAEIAVINSNIHDNNGSAMLACSYSKGVYFGGNTVSGNGFEGMFFCAKYPAVVESCSIEKGSAAWFFDSPWYGTANELVCAIDGETLSGSDLAAMKQSSVSWTAKPKAAPAAPAETDGEGCIRVSTVDE